MLSIVIIIAAILFVVTANIVYKKLQEMGAISTKYHPYTNEKTKEFYWEFIRVYFFVTCTIVFLVSGYFVLFIELLIITLLQIMAAYTIHKQDNSNHKEKIEVIFDEKDLLEQKEFLMTLKENERKKVVNTKKVVFHNDYLYFSKRRRILTREKMYKYIHISNIKKQDRLIIINYGFLGLPMFKKKLYIPKKKEKSLLNILHKIENNKRNAGFFQKKSQNNNK
ncbi:hypothetical protein ACWKTZ_24125 [Bacillus cereus]|uniref:hypothetical protein n=1 Tax=Bacillus cereus TaxID=1396 RepID=UPI003079DEB1